MWGCSTAFTVLPFYKRFLEHSSSHLEVGPGSGYYFVQPSTLPLINKLKRLTLLDLNPNPLRYASERAVAAGYTGPEIETYVRSVFDPLPLDLHGAFDTISLTYIFHCLPGAFPNKASHVAATLLPALAPGPDSTLYGSTILGRSGHHTRLGQFLMSLYNSKGIFSNYEDDAQGLKAGLAPYFEEVEVEIVGATALFVCKGPKTSRVA
jgi:SAM-dependent methyltransferase